MENAGNYPIFLHWPFPLQDQWWSKSNWSFNFAIHPAYTEHCKRYMSVLSPLTLCSNNKYDMEEVEMIIWGVGIQCRNWLLRIQTLRDCSSSGNICGGGGPNSANWESNFCSDSACGKGKYIYGGGPSTKKKSEHIYYKWWFSLLSMIIFSWLLASCNL